MPIVCAAASVTSSRSVLLSTAAAPDVCSASSLLALTRFSTVPVVSGTLSTVTVTGFEVVICPALSRATAVMLCWPSLAVVLFQVTP